MLLLYGYFLSADAAMVLSCIVTPITRNFAFHSGIRRVSRKQLQANKEVLPRFGSIIMTFSLFSRMPATDIQNTVFSCNIIQLMEDDT